MKEFLIVIVIAILAYIAYILYEDNKNQSYLIPKLTPDYKTIDNTREPLTAKQIPSVIVKPEYTPINYRFGRTIPFGYRAVHGTYYYPMNQPIYVNV